MTTERALTVAPQADLPSVEQWELTQRMAQAFHASGLYTHLKNVAQFIVVVQTGRELGVPPGAALRSFSFIGGKPTASAEMLAALIYRDHGDQALKVTESSSERCTVEYRRRGWDAPGRITFTMKDAETALLGKGEKANANWQKYPRAMLRSRAISEAARTAFQDSILGMHTTEEMAPEGVIVNDEGEVVPVDDAPESAVVDSPETKEPIALGDYERSRQEMTALPPSKRATSIEPPTPEVKELWDKIKAGLQADHNRADADAKLPKPITQQTVEELQKTLAWLEKRARNYAQYQADQAQQAAIEGEVVLPEATPPPPADYERRPKLSQYVDGVQVLFDAMTATRGPLKPDQISALGTVYEQGQLLMTSTVGTKASEVKPTELTGLIGKLRDLAVDELRAGEAPAADDDEQEAIAF